MEPVTITQTKGVKAPRRPDISPEKKSEQLPIIQKDSSTDTFTSSKVTKKDIGLMAITAVVVATPFAIIAAKGKKSIKNLEEMIKKGQVAQDTVLYMDYGQKEFEGHPHTARFDAAQPL